jgi:hypothetical protein
LETIEDALYPLGSRMKTFTFYVYFSASDISVEDVKVASWTVKMSISR